MSAAIPASFVRRARAHLREFEEPLVYGPRCKMDSALLVSQNPASRRWIVIFDARSIPALAEEFVVAVSSPHPEPGTKIMNRLAKHALIGLEGVPNRFEREGTVLGGFDECDGVVMVSDALAVSCLSWVLRERRTGLFLRVGWSV